MTVVELLRVLNCEAIASLCRRCCACMHMLCTRQTSHMPRLDPIP